MTPPRRPLSPQKEARLDLATAAIQKNKNLSVYKVAKLFNIARSTLRDRIAGRLPQAATNAQKQKLSTIKEQSLVH